MIYRVGTLLAAFVGVILLLPACATSGRNIVDTSRGDAINGKVVDQTTNQPISGAIVAVLWEGSSGYSSLIRYHVEATITDAHGSYHIPAWEGPSRYGKLSSGRMWMTANKSGYEFIYTADIVYRTPPESLFMKRFNGTVGERVDYLLHLSGVFNEFGIENRKSLFLFQKSLYEEARSIAATNTEKDHASIIRRAAARAWVARSTDEHYLTDDEANELIISNTYLREQLQ